MSATLLIEFVMNARCAVCFSQATPWTFNKRKKILPFDQKQTFQETIIKYRAQLLQFKDTIKLKNIHSKKIT